MRLPLFTGHRYNLGSIPGSPLHAKGYQGFQPAPVSPKALPPRPSELSFVSPIDLVHRSDSSSVGSLIPSGDTRPASVKYDVSKLPTTTAHRRTHSGQLISLSTSVSTTDLQGQDASTSASLSAVAAAFTAASSAGSAPLTSGPSSSPFARYQPRGIRMPSLKRLPRQSSQRLPSMPSRGSDTTDLELALRVLDKQHQLEPSDAIVVCQRGFAKLRLGDRAGAAKDLELALEMNSANNRAHTKRLQRALQPWWRRSMPC